MSTRQDIDPRTDKPFRTLSEYYAKAQELLEEPLLSYWEWRLDEAECYSRLKQAYSGLLLRTRALTGELWRGRPQFEAEVFGERVHPVGVSPSAFHGLATPDGEAATARGVAAAGGIYCFNYYYGTRLLEDVATVWREGYSGKGALWLHLYVHGERGSLETALRRAKDAGGFSAVVVTVDHPHSRVHRNTKPLFVKAGRSINTPNCSTDIDVESAGWEDLRWLCEASPFPVVAKGVLNVADARRAVAVGCKGIFVSGHGGRQCAQGPSTVEQLPLIQRAVGAQVQGHVFVDTGIRCGGHVVKGLALGARACFVGRPALYGLLCGGSEGVQNVLQILREEATDDMACVGAANPSDLSLSSFERIDGPLRIALGGQAPTLCNLALSHALTAVFAVCLFQLVRNR